MRREIFLENLPKHTKGTNKGKISWKDCVGCIVPFTYDDIEGKIEIIDYNVRSRKLIIKYGERIFFDKPISSGHFQNCILGYYLGVNTSEFKVNVGQAFKDGKRDLIIINREYRDSKKNQSFKYYKYTCNKCGWSEGWIEESDLLSNKTGCSCCNGKTVVPEINSIYAKAPWMMKWISEEDAKKYTVNSNKKIEFTCSDCGEIKLMRISDAHKRQSVGCKHCSDGISYPEKFIMSILNQLGVEFETQYSPEWIKPKRYDLYVPKYNIIIEVHGMQHYEYTGFIRNVDEESENDEYKKRMAINNGIKNYIELDCRLSNSEYMKNSVLNSELSNIFAIDRVNFEICNEFALNSLVKTVAYKWEEKDKNETIGDIAKFFNLSKPTVISYLKLGNNIGWCTYDAKKEMGSKRCIAFDLEGNIVCDEYSAREVARKMTELYGENFDYRNISMVCNGKRNHHKGFIFKYE